MLNPFNPNQSYGPTGFFSVMRKKKQLVEKMQAAKVDDQIFQVVQNAFEETLKQERLVVLPDIARKHLLAQVMKQVLGEMLDKLDGRKIT